jgi:endoglucanase
MRIHSFISACLVASVAAKFEFIGVNEAGPEFGEKNLPGLKNKDVR